MMLTNVQFHNAGYCLQNEFFTGTGTFRWRRFYAVFVSFEHPLHGRCVIDTGYGPAFSAATSHLPGRIMRHLLMTPRGQSVFNSDFLTSLDIFPEKVTHVFLSHYHADHIGGLSRFSSSKVVCRPQPLHWLQQLSPWKQLHNGFLPQLIPDDMEQRLLAVEESQFETGRMVVPDVVSDISTTDYWNDGSLMLMDLPGHGIGHTGYMLNTDQGMLCYVVDAFWDIRTFDQKKDLPWPARQVQYSMTEYRATQEKLRQFRESSGIALIACHCGTTQKYVRQ